MEKKNILPLIITLAVGIILAGSLLAPLLDDYSTATYTYTNQGMPFAAVDEDTHTITVDADGNITSDGVTLDLSMFPGTYKQYTIVYSDTAFVRYDINTVQVQTRYSGSAGVAYNFSDGVTITISGTSATIKNDRTSSSTTITDVTYYIASEGDYVLALNPYVTTDSVMYGAGQTYFGTSQGIPAATNIYVTWKGTLDDIDSTILYWSAGSTYPTNVPDGYTLDVSETYPGLFKVNAINIKYAITSTSDHTYSLQSKYTYFLAPKEIVYDNVNYIGSQYVGLLGAILTITIVGIVVAAIGAIFIRRND